MGWETRLTTTITFNRKTYDNIGEVQKDLSDVKDMIKYYRNKLLSLVMITEPKKFCEKDQDPMMWLQNEAEECIDELDSLFTEEYKLYQLKNDWDTCHTKEGDPIHPPKEFCNGKWSGECGYIDGDFILTKAEQEQQRKEIYGKES